MLLRQPLRCFPSFTARLLTPRLSPLALSVYPKLRRSESTVANSNTSSPHVTITPDQIVYRGPLTPTFKRIKAFSIGSLSLCITMAPVIFAVESNLPWSARAFLVGTAVGTSSASTLVIAWASRSYVTAMRVKTSPTDGEVQSTELTTLTMFLRPRITRVYDPLFLVPVDPPSSFAKLELPELVLLPPHLRDTLPAPGTEETVAETTDAQNRVLGRWIVRWGENGEGSCYAQGTVIRQFNVHMELLPQVTLTTETAVEEASAGPTISSTA
ncbi:hypothetical protein R3P38DRAFT_3304062 [Favolaschia claudopus]|uniref:Transmembrane protein n=1 Tax=Favolaschia claudopus TaxID=2862362 RepID=A0AAW0DX00_9AGAR